MVKHSNVCQLLELELKQFGKTTARVQYSEDVGAPTPSFFRGGQTHGTISWMQKAQRIEIRSLLNLHHQRYTPVFN